jgi:ADP-ribosylglycohydrolase
MNLSPAQLDRARGVLLATAAGDALGAGYEFGPPLADDAPVVMAGGGSLDWAPGEWTDDTSMAIAIAEVAAAGADLRTTSAQDAIIARWADWAETARDVGIQTREVLAAAKRSAGTGDGIAAAAVAASAELHRGTGRTAGNGSLMRTAPVALAYLGDAAEDALTEAATQVSALTHYDPEAGEACVLWCHLTRHAVRTGELDPAQGLRHLPGDRASAWAERLASAERARPRDFTANGWVVEALQAAWCAITTTPVPADDPAADPSRIGPSRIGPSRIGPSRADHLRLALESAVRGGRDADTVAAIAGGLLGGVHGASAVPAAWYSALHGWPGSTAKDLVSLATTIASRSAGGA